MDIVEPMEEGGDAKQRGVTSLLKVADIVQSMEEGGDAKQRGVRSML